MTTDWDHIRANKFATESAPPEWPPGVRPISLEGTTLFGIDTRTGRLFWDGDEIATSLRLKGREFWLAVIVAIGTGGVFLIEVARLVREIVGIP